MPGVRTLGIHLFDGPSIDAPRIGHKAISNPYRIVNWRTTDSQLMAVRDGGRFDSSVVEVSKDHITVFLDHLYTTVADV